MCRKFQVVATIFVMAFFPGLVYGQNADIAGKVSAPQICPSNPDLIAFEKQEGNTQRLYIYNKRTNQSVRVNTASTEGDSEGIFGGIFRNEGTDDLTSFEGQLAWRPGLDANKRHWFAYIANGNSGLDLFLSYVDEDGNVNSNPIQIPLDEQQFNPVWSPATGNHLAFMSGGSGRSNLFYITDMAQRLPTLDPSVFRAVPLTQGNSVKSSPAWSPDEASIVFEMESEEGGVDNRGIHLIYVDEALNNPIIDPINLTDHLNNYDEFQPSWSANGELIAFYVTQARLDEGSANQLQDIAILNVVRAGSQNRIVDSNQLSGLSPRLVENVIPHSYQGPIWIGDLPTNSQILYVKRDAQADFPIYLADLNLWQRLDRNYDQPVPNYDNTKNHLDASQAAIPGGVRIAYVGQVGSVNEIRTQDERWSAAQQRPMVTIDAGTRQGGSFSPIPGLGQFKKGQRGKGILFITATVLAAGAAGGAVIVGKSEKDATDEAEAKYLDALNEFLSDQDSILGERGDPVPHPKGSDLETYFTEWQDNFDKGDPLRNVFIGALAATGAVWLISTIDSAIGKGRTRAGTAPVEIAGFKIYSPHPQVSIAQGRMSYGVGMKIKF